VCVCVCVAVQARRAAAARVPVTPPESGGWMNRMMGEIWAPFVVPQMLRENLGAWQVPSVVVVRATWPGCPPARGCHSTFARAMTLL
jgi:hypothetical protein